MDEVHPDLRAAAPLVGTWTGDGEGHFPGLDDFAWTERMDVVSSGAPALSWRQRTRRPDGSPFHAEDGWLRLPPAAPDGTAELTVAQPTGIIEAHAGTLVVDGDGLVLDVSATAVAGTPTARTVRATRRRWRLVGDELHVDMWMATPRVPELTHHLVAVLHRA